jgi:hypothetical protein
MANAPKLVAADVRRLIIAPFFLALFITSFSLKLCLADDKITYQDQILPFIEANCSKCHNADKKKADLELTSYQAALKGSGSGAVLVSGSPDGSKLWKVLNHAEEPYMPPNHPKLGDKELDLVKKWITGGLLETADGKPIAATKPAIDFTIKADTSNKPDGPPPMPAGLPMEPVTHCPRMDAITGLAASPWAPLLAVAGEKQVLLYHTDTGEFLGVLAFSEGQPVEVHFSRNGKLLLAGGGKGAKSGRVVIWSVVTGKRLTTVGDDYDSVLAADLRADQSQVALGGPGRLVKIFDTKTGKLQHKIKKHTDWITATAFSPDGKILASADRNGGISLWDPDTAQELFTLAGHKSAVTALSWRPDSKLLASSSEDGTVKIWEMTEGKQVKNWNAHGSGTLSVNYSRDGRLVTCGRDNTVALWDGNGNKQRKLDYSGELPLRAVFSSDSKRVFTTDFTGHLAGWSTADGKRSAELDPNPPPLADQIVAQQKRTETLQLANTNTAKPDPKLIAAQDCLTRLQTAQVLASIQDLRDKLHPKPDPAKQQTHPIRTADQIAADQSKLLQLIAQYHSLSAKATPAPVKP